MQDNTYKTVFVMLDKFDIKRINKSETKKNNNNDGYSNYLKYNFSNTEKEFIKPLVIRVPEITLTSYGMARLMENNVGSSDFIKVPYDMNQQSCVNFFQALSEIDKYVKDNMDLFPEILKKHAREYHPLNKPNDAVINEVAINKPNSCKVKFTYGDGVRDTKFYNYENNYRKEVIVDKTIESQKNLRNVCRYKSIVSMKVCVDKIWFQPAYKSVRYGVTLRAVEVTIGKKQNIIQFGGRVEDKVNFKKNIKESNKNILSLLSDNKP